MLSKEAKEVFSRLDDMSFISIDDLFIKKTQIRKKYEYLEYYEKEIYKWYYFYQLCMIRWRNKEKKEIKQLFWEYINGKCNDREINEIYVEFCTYRDKSF